MISLTIQGAIGEYVYSAVSPCPKTAYFYCSERSGNIVCYPCPGTALGLEAKQAFIALQRAVDDAISQLPLARVADVTSDEGSQISNLPVGQGVRPIQQSPAGYDGKIGPFTLGMTTHALNNVLPLYRALIRKDGKAPEGWVDVVENTMRTLQKLDAKTAAQYAKEIAALLVFVQPRFEEALTAYRASVEPAPALVPEQYSPRVIEKYIVVKAPSKFPTAKVASLSLVAAAVVGVGVYALTREPAPPGTPGARPIGPSPLTPTEAMMGRRRRRHLGQHAWLHQWRAQ